MAYFDTGLSNGGLLRLHVNQGAQEIENNRTIVNWSLELINQNNGGRYASGTWYWSVGFGNGWEYLGHGSGANYNIGAYGSLVLASGSSWVGHNADGTYLRGFYGGFSDIPNYGWWGNGTASGDWAATTIPRATTPNWSGNFETGAAKTINLPRASSGFTHDVDYSFGSSGWVSIATGAGVSTSWTPPASLASQIPNASSGTGSIRVTTKSGSTTIGSKTATFTLGLDASVAPIVNTVTWDDANTTVKNNIGAFVQNASQIFGLVTSSGIHGSTIVKEELVVNGVTIPEASSLVVDMSGTITASGKATDSRNRIGTKAANIPVLAYVPPQVTAFEVLRSNSAGVAQDDGSYLKLVLSAAVQSLIVASTQKNAMTIVLKTKPKNGVWTTRNTITPGLTYNTSVLISGGATYPASTSYSVRVEITDKTGSTYIAETTVATGTVTLDLNDTKVGVGKFWEQGVLDVAGDIYTDGVKVSVVGHLHETVKFGVLDPGYVGGGSAKVILNGSLSENKFVWATPYIPNQTRTVSMVRSEDTWYIGGQTDPDLFIFPLELSSWDAYANTNNSAIFDPLPRATKLPSGLVVLAGMLHGYGTIAPDSLIATLPEGLRPEYRVVHLVLQGDQPRGLYIDPDGSIRTRSAWVANTYLSLDGVAFWASGSADWTNIGTGGSSFNNTNFEPNPNTTIFPPPRYFKDEFGFVWFEGVVSLKTAVTVGNTVMVNMPTTHRSHAETHIATVGNDTYGGIGTQPTNGLIWKPNSPGTVGGWMSLNNVVYPTQDAIDNNPWVGRRGDPNGWVKLGAEFTEPRWLKRGDGLCMLSGALKNGNLTASMAMLPTEMRPTYGRKILPTMQTNAIGRLNISATTDVTLPYEKGAIIPSMGGTTFYSWDGVKWIN